MSLTTKHAVEILEAGIAAVKTEKVVRDKISLAGDILTIKEKDREEVIDLNNFEKIYFVAIGKCAVSAAEAIEPILGDRVTAGIVLDVRAGNFKKFKSIVGTHPFPSAQNVEATREIMELARGAGERDLFIVVISGGGSSLLSAPHGMKPEDLRLITKTLMQRSAKISEVNTVRKHLSEVQGGRLAELAYPATVYSLLFSDVPGDDIDVIASGPTVKDKTTKEEAEGVAKKYELALIREIPELKFIESPKDDKYFAKVKNILLLTNLEALEAMKAKAEEFGYSAHIEDCALEGEAKEVGRYFAEKHLYPKTCLLYGGETTVTVKVKGKGGRCQDLVLGALPHIHPGRVVLASASDGWDNTDTAGAVGDRELYLKATAAGLSPEEHLEKNMSYDFFDKAGGRIVTGPTGVNISDLYIIIQE